MQINDAKREPKCTAWMHTGCSHSVTNCRRTQETINNTTWITMQSLCALSNSSLATIFVVEFSFVSPNSGCIFINVFFFLLSSVNFERVLTGFVKLQKEKNNKNNKYLVNKKKTYMNWYSRSVREWRWEVDQDAATSSDNTHFQTGSSI